MKSFFQDLYEYNHQCNQQLSNVYLEQGEKVPVRSVELFTHICFAHHTWMSRINKTPSSFGIWGKLPAVDLKKIDSENYLKLSYRNSKGESYTNTVGEVLFHVINHSTYHRGQIAMDLRLAGMEPLVTDYIVYKRRAR